MGESPERTRRLFKAGLAILAVGTLAMGAELHDNSQPKAVYAEAEQQPTPYTVPLPERIRPTTTTLPPETTTLPPSTAPPTTRRQPPAPRPRSVAPSTLSGSKVELMRAAGISEANFGYVDAIFSPESGWNPAAVSSNDCIGLGQNCPDSSGGYWLKEACPNWQQDPVCQIGRFAVYAEERYGSWASAASFHRNHGWW